MEGSKLIRGKAVACFIILPNQLSEEAQLLDLVTQGEDGTNMKHRKDIVQQMLRGEDKRQEHFKLHKDNLSLKYENIVRKKWYKCPPMIPLIRAPRK